MSRSKLKSSFSIDDILCRNSSATSASIPALYAYTNAPTMDLHDNAYGHTAPLFPNLLDFIPPKHYFPHPNQPTTFIDQYYNTFQKVTPNFIPYYSHPFSGGYILPGCSFKRKGGQVRFTPQQTQDLEQQFNNRKYLSPQDRKKLAIQLKLSDRQVKTWFQNRRAKWRRVTNFTAIGSSERDDVMCNTKMMHSQTNSPEIKSPTKKSSADDHTQHNQFVDSTTKSNCIISDS